VLQVAHEVGLAILGIVKRRQSMLAQARLGVQVVVGVVVVADVGRACHQR